MLNLENIGTNRVRAFMLEEVERDIANGTLYASKYFNGTGNARYPELLREAVRGYDDGWLAASLRQSRCMNATAMRRKPTGGFTEVKVPITAQDTFAEGEFNRFYARGLCRLAIEQGVQALYIYRAKPVAVPRPESQAKIGTSVDANALLEDLRTHQGVDTALGLPPGPNSGLSVRLAVANAAGRSVD
jgi:hypothetical protein